MNYAWANRFHTGDCAEVLRDLPEASVDLSVFSPPYDDLRTYSGQYSFDYERVGRELLRVTKEGGVVCVVIQDGTKDFAKSGTTARMQVAWMDMGWRLFECVIWERHGVPGGWWAKRFRVDHEFICIFHRGERPKSFDKTTLMVKPKQPGQAIRTHSRRPDGSMRIDGYWNEVGEKKCRGTIWPFDNPGDSDHPATFPERLAADLIQGFSRPGDLILDPYSGSGTTCIEANRLGREWIGIDISAEYVALSERRMWQATRQGSLPLEGVTA